MDDKTQAMLAMLAARNVCDGVLYEPRVFFGSVDFDAADQVNPTRLDAEIFRNGEDYPVRITHILAAIGYTTPAVGDFPTGDERAIQRYGMRLIGHGTYYMGPQYINFPLWHNRPSAAADIVTRAQSSWRYWRPFYMGQRDTLTVKVALDVAPAADTTRRVVVSFEGVGAVSRRPKKLTGFVDITAAQGVGEVTIPASFFRNDGAEPLEIHEQTVMVAAQSDAADPVGDIRLASVSVKLNGNGTNQRWTIGAPALSSPRAPGTLWGPTTGRAVVHELPTGTDGNPGWLWYPGEGLDVEIQNLSDRTDTVFVGLLGHAIIT